MKCSFLTILLTLFCMSEMFSQPLSVSIELDKKVFQEAEEISLLIKVRNISSSDVLMLPFSAVLTDYGLEVILKDSKGREIPLAMFTSGNGSPDYTILSPNDSISTFESLTSDFGFRILNRTKAIRYIPSDKYKVQVRYHHMNPEGKTEEERSKVYLSNEIEFEVMLPKNEKEKQAHDEMVLQAWGPDDEKKCIEFLEKYPNLDVSKTIYS